MHKILLLFCLLAHQYVFSQYKLRIEISVPLSSKNDTIFLAGNFNNWQPRNNAFPFSKNDKLIFEQSGLPEGMYEYKFTRGSWDKVETNSNGADIKNRVLHLTSDTTLQHSIEGWKDDFLRTSLSPQVHFPDTSFHMSELNRQREISIYLPPGYKSGSKRYPVFYMHDGQNLFGASRSAMGEWGVDEILDSLINAGKQASIIVGIHNGPERLNEYNPCKSAATGDGEGTQYINFIVNELKPYIDKRYKTLASKENTVIAGSSLGGLISYYAALAHPSVFGKAGVFSPSFPLAPSILQLTDSLAPRSRGMFFFYMGEKEGDSMMNPMKKIIAKLGENSNALIYTVSDPEGRHNEEAWRKWFTEFYLWATSNGLNHIIR